MNNFISLFKALDETSDINIKYEALVNYFRSASADDSVWVLSFLSGRKIKRTVSIKKLQEWTIELTQIPQWLFDECFDNVGDLAETFALLLPAPVSSEDISLKELIELYLIPLRNHSEIIQKERIITAWQRINSMERYVFNKLLTGTFHFNVPVNVVIKAFSYFCGLNKSVISQRLSGIWIPSKDFYDFLISPDVDGFDKCKPYSFSVPIQFIRKVEELGELSNWLIEWKLKGTRSQLIKRNNQVYLWSIDEDFLNDTFPHLIQHGTIIPDGTVLDGIITSDIFIAFDLLEFNSNDLRGKPLSERRALLEELIKIISYEGIMLSKTVDCCTWENLKKLKNDSRNSSVDGLILKRLSSTYCAENHDFESWYKWKKDPLYVNAVLLYALKEQRSAIFKEYTFAIWNGKNLIPFAKTSIGLEEEEKIKIAEFIRNNTIEKFGPVRTVKPELVFELEFDGIQKSSRHKSGFLVKSPRIVRWHKDKNLNEVNSLNSILIYIDL